MEVKSAQVPYLSIVLQKTSMRQVIWRACRGRNVLTSTWTKSTHQVPEEIRTLPRWRRVAFDLQRDRVNLTIRASMGQPTSDQCMITRGTDFRPLTWMKGPSQRMTIIVTMLESVRGAKTRVERPMGSRMVCPCSPSRTQVAKFKINWLTTWKWGHNTVRNRTMILTTTWSVEPSKQSQ